jgi:hypothetical protein
LGKNKPGISMRDRDYDQHNSAPVGSSVALADGFFVITASKGTLLLITKIVRARRFLCVNDRYFIDLLFLAFPPKSFVEERPIYFVRI